MKPGDREKATLRDVTLKSAVADLLALQRKLHETGEQQAEQSVLEATYHVLLKNPQLRGEGRTIGTDEDGTYLDLDGELFYL